MVYADDGEVRLLEEDGSLKRLSSVRDQPQELYSTVKFDARAPRVAWLARDDSGVMLHVHEFLGEGSEAQYGTNIPCEGKDCRMLSVAGIDQGLQFVRRLDRDETLVFDDQGTLVATLEGFTVADVRNRVVLGQGTLPTGNPLGEGWRFVEAEGPESLLTFDGGHELLLEHDAPEHQWRDAAPARRTSQRHEFVTLDSDGSVLVAVTAGTEPQRYFDCELPSGECTPIGTLDSTSGDPIFLGNDM